MLEDSYSNKDTIYMNVMYITKNENVEMIVAVNAIYAIA